MDKVNKDTIILAGYQILALLMFSHFSYLRTSNMTTLGWHLVILVF